MGCNRDARYYVVNEALTMVYGYNKIGNLSIVDYLPWTKPYLFYGVKQARRIAEKLGYTVRFYPGKTRVNHPSDNR